ncbi:MAG: hypothetical protein WDZ53_11520 [Balneolales bacterium]
MTIFLYGILAIGFVVSLIVLFSAMTDIRENRKDKTAQRDIPQDEQQHDTPGNVGKARPQKAPNTRR